MMKLDDYGRGVGEAGVGAELDMGRIFIFMFVLNYRSLFAHITRRPIADVELHFLFVRPAGKVLMTAGRVEMTLHGGRSKGGIEACPTFT
jgi:hypothetical protein